MLPDGVSLTNGSITATRIADGGVGGPMSITDGTATSADDQSWSGGTVSVVAKARYAGDDSDFGWINDTPAPQAISSYQTILNTGTLNNAVTVSLSPAFRWAFHDPVTGETFTSRPGDNPHGGNDQMATYKITGVSPSSTWLLVWEDRSVNSDHDFNDAAIQIMAVPAPGALVASLGLLTAATGRRRRGAR